MPRPDWGRRKTDRFEPAACVMGRHREMLDQLLRFFDITPHHDLDLMKPGQAPYQITTRALELGLPLAAARGWPLIVVSV